MADAPSFRQLAGVGVAGLLSEGCKVLYTNVFSQRHLGRISDLIAAKLRGTSEASAQDELKLRALLLFAAFEGWRSRVAGEPLSLECGYDETHVAVGVTFKAEFRAGAPFESLLGDLKSKSNTVVIRSHVTSGTIEVVSILKRGEPQESPGVVVETEISGEAPEAPQSAGVTELGDLDYSHLLAADGPAAQEVAPSPAGEIISRALREKAEARKLEAQALPEEAETTVEGGDELIEPDTTVKGAPEESDQTETTVDGDEREKPSSITVAGSGKREKEEAIRIAADPLVKEDNPEIRIKAEPRPKKKKGFFSKVLSFGGGEEEEADETVEGFTASGEPVAAGPAIAVVASGVPQAEGEIPAVVSSGTAPAEIEADATTSKLLTEFQEEVGGMDRVLNKAQADATQLKRDERIRLWADGLMGELLTEKARLGELSKRISLSVRQKEIEFRNKERALQQEIRAREDAYKQEHHRLVRMKEQLNQANMTVERLKSGTVASADDGHYKQKYAHVQKLLVNTKDENVVMKAQLEDAKGELNQLKQMVKRQNQMLAERPADKKKAEPALMGRTGMGAAPVGLSDADKKKLEIAAQQAAKAQKEAELFKLKFEESQKEETRLKAEILRLQRQIANPGSSGGASMSKQPKPGAPKPAAPAKPGQGKPPKAA